MLIQDITSYLESLAPLSSQESYDNSGLITGHHQTEVTNALITLDCIEDTIDEAMEKGCNLIIAHHPIVFKGIKRLNGKNYVERTIIKAIKNDIAIYACHTNLDNYKGGVNKKIGDLLEISNPSILSPSSSTLEKLSVFAPTTHQDIVKTALFKAGAGAIGNYTNCSFVSDGKGSFQANDSTNPFVGNKNEIHIEPEVKIEVILSTHKRSQILKAMLNAHPYESVAYDLFPLLNQNNDEGAGMYGTLKDPLSAHAFLTQLKKVFKCEIIKHTNFHTDVIKTVAWCGGSGSFLLGAAKAVKADIFITGDFKYHEFFDAENQIIIADIGHFESEQFTIDLIGDILSKKFTKFAPYLTDRSTNPVNYF
ncbi:MAG: Nif3-like dinuclear metal center hexameric protein [Crocinitomicaceae bacterium]